MKNHNNLKTYLYSGLFEVFKNVKTKMTSLSKL